MKAVVLSSCIIYIASVIFQSILESSTSLGNSLDVDNIDVYRVEDGKIVKATIYSADLQQENLCWGK